MRFLIFAIFVLTFSAFGDEAKPWRFVSMPDFLNVDTDYPQKGWEESLTYVLQAVKAEKPDFVMVAGDRQAARVAGVGSRPEQRRETRHRHGAHAGPRAGRPVELQRPHRLLRPRDCAEEAYALPTVQARICTATDEDSPIATK